MLSLLPCSLLFLSQYLSVASPFSFSFYLHNRQEIRASITSQAFWGFLHLISSHCYKLRKDLFNWSDQSLNRCCLEDVLAPFQLWMATPPGVLFQLHQHVKTSICSISNHWTASLNPNKCWSSRGNSMIVGANDCRFSGEPRGAALLFGSIMIQQSSTGSASLWQGPVPRWVIKRNSWTDMATMETLEPSWTPREDTAFPILLEI